MEQILPPLVGGILIGLASLGMMFFNGRIAGISGIFRGGLLPEAGETLWRWVFVGGLVAGGVVMMFVKPTVFPTTFVSKWPVYVVAGLLVGFGTRLGSGCTSGHGICGISRFSARSIVATLTFITTGAITVFLMKMIGGAS
tara:strand:- start:2044 stop:2466 length:423 start_codon:yes stop_codon:yes gene_type:complete